MDKIRLFKIAYTDIRSMSKGKKDMGCCRRWLNNNKYNW